MLSVDNIYLLKQTLTQKRRTQRKLVVLRGRQKNTSK